MEEFKLPKYYLVKKAIVEKIDNEEFPIGALIPSERELMAILDVSRITVRRAIEELEQEGYLYKVQGKGTYVKGDQNSQDLISITSCTQDVERLGMKPSREVLRAEVMMADKKRQRKLNIGDNDKVFFLSRIYYADDEPINYTRTYLPYKLVKGIETRDFSKESLYDVLEKEYGIALCRANRSVEAIIAHDEIAEYLHVQNGVPLLLFECTTYGLVGGKEIPVETFKCCYRSDRFKFYINQVR